MAEDDLELTRRGAVVGEGGAVVRVGGGGGARVLEEVGVGGGLTREGAVEVVPAAELVGAEGLAAALTGHHVARRRPLLQSRGAGGDEVGLAADDWADAIALVGGDGEGDVEAVDEADEVGGAVVVVVVEAELDEGGGGGAAEAFALEAAGAVAGGAGEVAAGVVGAPGAGPDAAGPVLGGGGEGAVGEGGEGEAAALEDLVAGVGLDGGPNGEGAVVDEG